MFLNNSYILLHREVFLITILCRLLFILWLNLIINFILKLVKVARARHVLAMGKIYCNN